MQSISGKIEWTEQHKIRVHESDESQVKHLIVKALIMFHIKLKHRNQLKWIKSYSEFPVTEGKICDVYYENIKTKEAYAYEIQKDTSKVWQSSTKESYKDWEVYGIRTTGFVLVDLNKLSDDLKELSAQVKEIVL